MTDRFAVLLTILLLAGFATACGGDEAPGEEVNNVTEDTSAMTRRSLTNGAPAPPPCPVAGELLPENWRMINQSDLFLAVVADSTTYEEPYGAGHRVLVLYDTSSCEQLDRQVLPVNRAPDYAYQIAEIIYNNNSRLVALRGFDVLYAYDVAQRKLLPQLSPRFKSERPAVDAQSGMIRRVEVWENFLIGYAQDYGVFVFDLRTPSIPEAVLPLAEYRAPDNGYASLFLLPSGDRYQLLLPDYNPTAERFAVTPLLEEPRTVSTNVPESARNNRFLVLRTTGDDRTAIAIDMLQRRRVELPAELQTASTGEILEWLKGRVDG